LLNGLEIYLILSDLVTLGPQKSILNVSTPRNPKADPLNNIDHNNASTLSNETPFVNLFVLASSLKQHADVYL
jgi:hypothetical protein